jgi:hypothetical protein
MRVKTEDGRVFTLKLGTLFDCAIQEPEWFPEYRASVYAVFCGPTSDEAIRNDPPPPKVGDFIFVDFQQGGPCGKVWRVGPIVEILGEEEPPADWSIPGFKDIGIKVAGLIKRMSNEN